MGFKRIIFLGDSHLRGDGTEWPGLWKKIIKFDQGFNQQAWSHKVRTCNGDYKSLRLEFDRYYGPKMQKHAAWILETRDKESFAARIAKYFNVPFTNYSNSFTSISEMLPFLNYTAIDLEYKDSFFLVSLPPAIGDVNYRMEGEKLKNVTIPNYAAQLMLIKEFIENRGGMMCYFHSEDYPEELYDMTLNPYLMDLGPLRVFEGHLGMLLGSSYQHKRMDGKHYDLSGQKMIAHLLIQKLDSPDFFRIL